jgi:hypothetical protein
VDGLGYDDLLAGSDPAEVSWALLISAVKTAVPDAALTVWCAEDAPTIFPAILHQITGLSDDIPVAGGLDLIAGQTSPEGQRRLRAWLAQNPPESEAKRRRVLRVFYDKYAWPEPETDQTDLPGWDTALTRQLRGSYAQDQQRIAATDGVTFLTP